MMTFNDGVEAAAKVMDDLDRGGWFAAAIRARAKLEYAMPEDKILDAMVEAAAAHFNIAPEPDDPDLPAVRRCMVAIQTRLRADGAINEMVQPGE